MEQEESQGWHFSEKHVCVRCVKEAYLKTIIRAASRTIECDFCSGTRAAPFDALMEVIGQTWRQYYTPAVNHLSYDHEDGYFGTTYDTWDVVFDDFSDVSDNEDVLNEIIESIGDETWCKVNPYGFSGEERYQVSWEQFCRTVKHKTRYFFDSPVAAQEQFGSDHDLTPVAEVLAEIARVIRNAGLDATIGVETPLFRVRPHESPLVCGTASDLGPPPDDVAVNNRMSAAGVSVFYGAFDLRTAALEVAAGLPRRHGKVITGAEWRTTRELHVIDLSRLPELGSWYSGFREDRAPFVFLKQFVREITQPVAHDGKEHIEYVPTQILTEYLRLNYAAPGKQRLHGLVYPSARSKNGRSVVLFVSHHEVTWLEGREAPVRLIKSSIQVMKVPRRRNGTRRRRSRAAAP
jgi:hypothetical protein